MAEQAASRIRRVHKDTPVGVRKLDKKNRESIEITLRLILEQQAIAAKASALVKSAEAELMESMRDFSLTTFECEEGIAEITRSAGRATNVIDPKALAKMVNETDFYSAITVSVTKAKSLLGTKELEKITTSIPGTPGEEKIKVSRKNGS